MSFEGRVRQARDLIAHELRAINTGPLLGGLAAACLIVGLGARRRPAAPEGLLVLLIFAGLTIALGTAFIFDDPATDSISSTPTSLLERRFLRMALTGFPIAAVWGALLVFLRLWQGPGAAFGLPTLAFAAMLMFVLAAAAYGARVVADGLGGLIAGPALLVFVGLSRILPPRFHFFDARSGAGYSVSLRLSIVIGICAVALLWASLDPGRVNHLRSRVRQR